MFLGELARAAESMAAALASNWASAENKKALCLFSLGKIKQMMGLHREAVEHFSGSIELDPSNAYVYFRRAWSFKVSNCCLLLSQKH